MLPAGLQAHLDGGATTLCRCWKLTASDGEVLGFTDHDRDIVFAGTVYEADSGFTASDIETGLGLAVANLEAAGALRSDRLSEARLRAGLYDNAAIEIWLVNWQDGAQRLLLRKGNLGEVTHGDLGFAAEVRGLAHLLNQPRGRVFQHGCDAVVGDQRCGVDLAAPGYRGIGTVAAVESDGRVTASGLGGFAEGWFARGMLEWTSGGNQGRSAQVKLQRGGVIELWAAMAEPVMAGDGFAVTAGCDKQFATCKAKFGNELDFRGFPHMPGNDFVASYPNRDDADNDGASRA